MFEFRHGTAHAGFDPALRPLGSPSGPSFLPAGDTGMVVEFGSTIDADTNAQVVALDARLAEAALPGVIEAVPTYRSLLIQFEPDEISFARLAGLVLDLLDTDRRQQQHTAAARRWLVPVAYGGGFGEDLGAVAQACGLTEAAVARAHATGCYSVYMIGFAPGFTYLGGLPPALHLPRRTDPRARIPGGSIIVGGMQAAVAATPIPSGWHVLGRTPVRAFDLRRDDPFLFRTGDQVRFRPVCPAEFACLERRAEAGEPVVACQH